MVKLSENNNIKEVSTVNGSDKDPNGIYLDFDTQAIPDLNNLTTEIINFLEYINNDDMESMEKNNFVEYKNHLEQKFPDFSLNYINIFNMLLVKHNREYNLMKLLTLFDTLKEIKDGNKDINNEYNIFKESQAQEYIYPKFGGKRNFEKHIKDRSKNKK